ncbi:hypothetical protein SB48_HM08orf01009 [Heyndrickxia coagulans]|uniref:Uncharacterized protein n=1 Tax=Heyndrickxia coagulans TaxID=1398 RepID=A0AAN0T413_HEYCO|nr:hypothetical protein SB48_HM08orf01009 [Heyndrickxia coagulans]
MAKILVKSGIFVYSASPNYDDDLSQLDPTTKRERWEEKYLT